MRIFNRTRAGDDARRKQDLLAHGFELLRGPDGPQTPTPRILSGPEVPTLPHDPPLALRTARRSCSTPAAPPVCACSS